MWLGPSDPKDLLQARQGVKTSNSGLGKQTTFYLEEICCCFASYPSTETLIVASALGLSLPLRAHAVLGKLARPPLAPGMARFRSALSEHLISLAKMVG